MQRENMAKMGAKNMEELFTEIEEKRSTAAGALNSNNDLQQLNKRGGGNSFSAWGGKKRSSHFDFAKFIKESSRSRRNSGDLPKVMRPARAAFSAWGGR
jgi:hypothetical protein